MNKILFLSVALVSCIFTSCAQQEVRHKDEITTAVLMQRILFLEQQLTNLQVSQEVLPPPPQYEDPSMNEAQFHEDSSINPVVAVPINPRNERSKRVELIRSDTGFLCIPGEYRYVTPWDLPKICSESGHYHHTTCTPCCCCCNTTLCVSKNWIEKELEREQLSCCFRVYNCCCTFSYKERYSADLLRLPMHG